MPWFNIRVTQLVQKLSDGADQVDLVLGEDRKGATKLWAVAATSEEAALDAFHRQVPLGCLDDFDVLLTQRALGDPSPDEVLHGRDPRPREDLFQTVLDTLNTAAAADPTALRALLINVVPVNEALAQHPTIPVQPDPPQAASAAECHGYYLTAFGLLNGVLQALGLPQVTWESDPATGLLRSFVRYDEPGLEIERTTPE